MPPIEDDRQEEVTLLEQQDSATYTINLERKCDISDEKLEALGTLLAELIPLANIPDAEHLSKLLVVPDVDIERTVNELLENQDERQQPYKVGNWIPKGVAVPLAVGETLECIIIIAESLAQTFTTEQFNAGKAISTILEELIHVRLYSSAWQRNGRLQPAQTLPIHKKDLYTLCVLFHDEYIVARQKALTLSSVLLIRYDDDLATLLNEAGQELDSIITKASKYLIPPSELWEKVARCIHRKIFDPLARDAGLRAGNPQDTEGPVNTASKSSFYRNHAASYWQEILIQLEHSWDSQLEETGAALDTIIAIIEMFLRHIGITFRVTANNESRIFYTSQPLQS